MESFACAPVIAKTMPAGIRLPRTVSSHSNLRR